MTDVKKADGRSISDFWLDQEEGKLHPAEHDLLEAVANGWGYEIAEERPHRKTDDNLIRAEFIRFLALGGDEENPIHERGIRLKGACIENKLNFDSCTLEKDLVLINCHIDRAVFFTDATTRNIVLDGCKIPALHAGGGHIRGNLKLSNHFESSDEVTLLGAKIEGQLNCKGGHFNGTGKSLSCDSANIHGGVFLKDGFSAEGEVRLLGAAIKGQLNCKGGHFNGTEDALDCEGANIHGHVFLNDGFSAEGVVSLLGAAIDGDLTIEKSTFNNNIFIEETQIKGIFYWTNVDVCNGVVSLVGARIGSISFDQKSWNKPEYISLDNCEYGRFDNLPENFDAAKWKQWLEKQADEHLNEDFRPQPYSQLANVLTKSGHIEIARKIRIEQEKRHSNYMKLHPPKGGCWNKFTWVMKLFWRWIIGFTIGYGYAPFRAFFILLFIIGCGTIVNYSAGRVGIMAPTNALIYDVAVNNKSIPIKCTENWVHMKGDCKNKMPTEYTTFSALWYTTDIVIPIIDFRQTDDWAPQVTKKDGRVWKTGVAVRWIEWLLTILGWGLSALFVAALSGLVRRD